MYLTFKYRLKNSASLKELERMSRAVNFTWNYCNDVSMQYLDKQGKWLTGYDLDRLTVNCSKDLGLHSHSIKLTCHCHAVSRKVSGKRKLSWRSNKRSLAWIPFVASAIKINGDVATYWGCQFRFWNSRPLEGKIKEGQFTRDARGNWFMSVICESQEVCDKGNRMSVGVDLGLKSIATMSTGIVFSRGNITKKYAEKLAIFQRAKKKKQTRSIHDKIKNIRKDWSHKKSTELVNSSGKIVVGDVSSSKLKRTRMAKSVSDAGWYQFKSMLAYKAAALGVEYKEINEKFSTVTCSTCFERTGPRGLGALGVREWICKCGASHDRDVNAAKNILRFGCEAPIKGTQRWGTSSSERGTIDQTAKL